MLALFALLAAAFAGATSHRMGPGSLRFCSCRDGVAGLALIWAYPVNVTDVFGYVIRGELPAPMEKAPFSPAAAFVGDPFMPLVGNGPATPPLRTAVELIAAGLTAVSGDNSPPVLLFKGLALACFSDHRVSDLGTVAGRPPAQRLYMLLWAWNRAAADIYPRRPTTPLMLLWLLLGRWMARRGRPPAFW